MTRHPLGLLLVLAATVIGCGDDGDELLIDNLPGGNPLVPQVAMYPFPSDFYLSEDETSATGRRLAFAAEAMPGGLGIEPFDGIDGYSRAPLIMASFGGAIDPASLPAIDDPSAALADSSSVMLLREQTWDRIPLLVEVDLNAANAEQALLMRPQIALEPNAGYVVVIRDSLRHTGGQPVAAPDAFRALRDGIATEVAAVEAQRDDFELVKAAIAGAGLSPQQVVLAWSFHTRSAEQLFAPMLALQDAASAAPLDDYTITTDSWDDSGDNRIVTGTFVAPDFLGAEEQVALDGDGAPVVHGSRDVPFLLTIPKTAAQQLRPVIVFGHGFLARMEEPTWGQLNGHLQDWQMAAASTEFIGFNEDDTAATLNLLTSDLDRTYVIPSQQMQSQANFTMLARLVAEQLSAVVLSDAGTPLFDPGEVHFMGISNGGTQGITIMAASAAFRRGAMVVPGGAWMHMVQRAVQWTALGALFSSSFDDAREVQLALSLLQHHFDYIDGVNWMDHLTANRLRGPEQVEVTFHEAVADAQVANMITEWLVRSGDIPLITPSPREVWGTPTIAASDLASKSPKAALYIYDEGYAPLTPGNIPPLTDNGAHETIRDLSVYQQHVGTFLETGAIEQVCSGPCDPD